MFRPNIEDRFIRLSDNKKFVIITMVLDCPSQSIVVQSLDNKEIVLEFSKKDFEKEFIYDVNTDLLINDQYTNKLYPSRIFKIVNIEVADHREKDSPIFVFIEELINGVPFVFSVEENVFKKNYLKN